MKRSTLITLICSMIAAIVVVMGGILIMIASDAIDVGRKKLVISSASSAAIYDGTPLSNSKWYLTEGDLKENHQLSVNVTGVQTTVGISENHLSAKVYDENGVDVTEDYTIEYKPGMLNVKARDLSLIAESAFKLYDGTPLTCDEYVIESAISLLPGDQIDVSIEGSITEIGEELNRITQVSVKDDHGEDVTRNYNVKTKDGKLIVLSPTTLLISTKSDAKVYDGTPLVNETWTIESGDLRSGHVIKVDVSGSQTEAGSSDNSFEVTILDEFENDVTDQYEIKYLPGTLTVLTTEVQIITKDAEMPYDGTELTKHQFDVYPSAFVDKGYRFVPVFTGSQTEVGSSENTVNQDMTMVFDPQGNNVTDSFKITYEYGKLTVTEALPLISPDMVVFEVYTEKTTTLYLKEYSRGDYDLSTKSWKNATEYQPKISGNQSAYYLPSYAMSASSMPLSQVTINPVADVYAIPYYAAVSTETQPSDVVMSGKTDHPYTVKFYDYQGGRLIQSSSVMAYEQAYWDFVDRNYKFVDEENLRLMNRLIQENGFDATDPNIITQVANYIRKSATYSTDDQYLGLNNPIDQARNPVEAFFALKEGVCRHYALSATLLYRALGIPARYTEGYMANVPAGKLTQIKGDRRHAWVEVYVQGLGWQYVDVTGSVQDDSKPEVIKLTVTPTSASRQYDGTSLVAPQTASGLSELESLGYTYELVVSGSRATPGKTSSEVRELIIRDADGKIVYQKSKNIGVDRFEITYKKGTLHLYRSELVFQSDDLAPKTYDGSAISGTIDQIHLISGRLNAADGYSLVILPTGSRIDEGRVDNSFEVTIYQNGVDVTDEFKITKKFGKITVNKREITITSDSASCKFTELNGALTCNTYSVDNLAETDDVSVCRIVGSLDYFGICDNTIEEVVIVNQAGEPVTSNYSITYVFGTLKVT